jgi:hypothetical protein
VDCTVTESNQQVQSQRDYLPLLDLSINQAKQQTSILHIGTHILSESSMVTGCDVTESDVIIPKVDDSPWV